MATWQLGDDHTCALTSYEHVADAECVAYAEAHGDREYAENLVAEVERLRKVEEAAQKTVNAYEAYGFSRAVEHRVRLLRATLEARP